MIVLKEMSTSERRQLLEAARGKNLKRVAPLAKVTIPRVPRTGPLALSFAQERLWFVAQMEGGSQAYHVPFGIVLRGPLNVAALESALSAVVERHEVLRTTFGVESGVPVQRIAASRPFALRVEDVRSTTDTVEALRRHADQEARAPFDLDKGPLIRACLVRHGEDAHALLVTMHHIVSDAWSMGILIREVSACYAAAVNGTSLALPPLTVQYADYAAWQRSDEFERTLGKQRQYWQERLSGAPVLLELPLDRVRPARRDYVGGYVALRLDDEMSEALRKLAHRHEATLFMVLLAAWAATLSILSRQHDVVIGTGVANRGHAQIEGLIGFFINTLAVRVQMDEELTIAGLLAQVKARALEAYAHQDIPLEQVVEAINPPRSMAHSPLFQVTFAWQGNESREFKLPGLSVLPVILAAHRVAKFDLSLLLQEVGSGIAGGLEYATALFDRSTVERFAEYLRRVLQAMVSDESQRVDEIDLVSPSERYRLLVDWNGPVTGVPTGGLHELFDRQAARTPHAVAVQHGQRKLSYAQLRAQSNKLAHYLREQGVVEQGRVGLCADRSIESIVAMLAVIKAGAGYVPLDPSYPEQRLRFMVQDCELQVLLTQSSLSGVFDEMRDNLKLIELDGPECAWAKCPDGAPRPSGGRELLAYVIYTSGSTGQPKGVMIDHGAVIDTVCCTNYVDFNDEQVVAHLSNISFDAATWEIWGALLNGARLVCLERQCLLTPALFAEEIRSSGITLMVLTTAMFNQLAKEHCEVLGRLNHVMFGGELGDAGCVSQVLKLGRPNRLVHGYGPTETTVCSIWYEVHEIKEGCSLPIGKAVSNKSIYILDGHRRLAPIGVAGEIHIGGAGVARGYLNRPALTAERFLPDPFSAEPNARMYRTGDLGRWLPDGNVEFLGRNDHQVKVRGYRIELGEIEARLAQHEQINEVVVVAREDTGADKQLVAYFTVHGETVPGVEQLRSHLEAALPDYMVPAAYVLLGSLPLTPNGKVDRKALPAPDSNAFSAKEYAAPQGELEESLAQIWRELLKIDRVGRYDNFFELGGHSLLAVQVISRVRQVLGREVVLRTLFEHSTVEAFAKQLVDASVFRSSRIERADRGRALPLSYAQQRLWFIDQFGGGASKAYHIAGRVRLKGSLELRALRAALDTIVERHETLRTVFRSVDGQPVQVIQASKGFALKEIDLSVVSEERREEAVKVEVLQEGESPFDLSNGPMIRGRLLKLSDQEHVLLITMHHIASDGWSMGILLRELGILYGAYREGRNNPLPELPIQYADYALWQRQWLQGEVLDAELGYWRESLSGAPPVLRLPTDRARPATQSYRGSHVGINLTSELSAKLKELSRREGTTLFMTLLTGFAIVLSRLSGQDEVVIGTPVANRQRTEVEGLIGFFVNMLALRARPNAQSSVRELLHEVRQMTVGAFSHQETPFEQIVEVMQPERSLSHSPLFQVTFALQNLPPGEWQPPGLSLHGQEAGGGTSTAQFDVSLLLQEAGDRIVGVLNYASDLFDRESVERWVGYLRNVWEGMANDAEKRVSDLAMLPDAERRQLLEVFNDTAASYPQERCVQELFEDQVARDPHAVAVIYEDEQLSYAALNDRANRLAHYLIEQDVRPDSLVAISMDRSPEMIVAVLGVLKAGGAYVPLDSTYPRERLQFMLRDAGPKMVLTQEHVRAEFLERYSNANLAPAQIGLTSKNLAYVIYTSGSTGQPKGVMVEHRNLTNLVCWHCKAFELSKGNRSSCVAKFGFDAAAWEVWPPLCTGAALLLSTSQATDNPEELIEWWEKQRIDVSFLPTPIAELAFGRNSINRTLRTLLVGGDRLREWPDNLGSLRVVNNYGPTEATVVATSGEVVDAHLHIGRPISNTQIYILDSHRHPVPLRVTGEIYIGGAGVARGYLNRPELTAERFVTDPFSAQPNARLYRTGDLGRWLADGTIEFLGRNDDQVKVRGYRIELGEIESQLALHEQIREAVVVAREEARGQKQLVAYFTVRGDAVPSVSQLRGHLTARLPEYMVPAAYVLLGSLPLTPNGKIDRKALPAPDSDAFSAKEYEPPTGEIEERLAQIWRELLKIERVGRYDNFFELGGHSLLAVQLISRVRRELGRVITLRQVFLTPVLKDMAAQQADEEDSAARDSLVQMDQEILLDPSIRPEVASEGWTATPAEILLTGATGFLGAFLLSALLERTSARIHCLIRCADEASGHARLRECFEKVELRGERIDSRVVIVPGDFSLPRLGLTAERFQQLGETIEAIYQCGAWAHALHGYDTLKSSNVDSTRWMLRLTCTGRPKHLHFISSLDAIPPVSPGKGADLPPHQRARAEWNSLPHSYAKTKWVSEQLLRSAAERGIGCSIYRPTYISGCSRTGASNNVDLLSHFMDACFELKCVPEIDQFVNMLPVDHVADHIVKISQQPHTSGTAHNIGYDEPFNLRELMRCIHELDPSAFPFVSMVDFLFRCFDNPKTEFVAALLNNPKSPLRREPPADVSSGVELDAALFTRYVRWRFERRK